MSDTTRVCPHCGVALEAWIGPPESGWGEILVCQNNQCAVFRSSKETIRHKEEDSPLGCRYAEDPQNNYASFNLLAWRG